MSDTEQKVESGALEKVEEQSPEGGEEKKEVKGREPIWMQKQTTYWRKYLGSSGFLSKFYRDRNHNYKLMFILSRDEYAMKAVNYQQSFNEEKTAQCFIVYFLYFFMWL